MTALAAADIVIATARQFGLRPWQLQERAGNGKGRHWRLVCQAKWTAMRALRDQGASLPTIGRALGMRHHQPVVHGLRRLAESAHVD